SRPCSRRNGAALRRRFESALVVLGQSLSRHILSFSLEIVTSSRRSPVAVPSHLGCSLDIEEICVRTVRIVRAPINATTAVATESALHVSPRGYARAQVERSRGANGGLHTPWPVAPNLPFVLTNQGRLAGACASRGPSCRGEPQECGVVRPCNLTITPPPIVDALSQWVPG